MRSSRTCFAMARRVARSHQTLPRPSSGQLGAVAAADRAIREIDSSAAFELEQALWRGGLRGRGPPRDRHLLLSLIHI